MKKTTILLATLLFLATFTQCVRLDGLLFNPYTDIEEYTFDEFSYDHYSFFALDDSHTIPDSLIHLFTLETDNSETIYLEYVGDISKIATDTVILYCHGNTGHMDTYWQRTKLLANVGGKNHYGVLTLDYQGFGLSSGSPSEDNMYSDADRAMQWLKDQGLTNDRLMMYGFSLGSAPTCELTSKPRTLAPSKIILEAPFASADVMVADGSLLDMPASYVVNLEIDNAEEIKNINQPLLWMHGNMDDFLQMPTHGQVVFDNHSGIYKESVIADGGEHSTVPQTLGIDVYKQIVYNFITKH